MVKYFCRKVIAKFIECGNLNAVDRQVEFDHSLHV